MSTITELVAWFVGVIYFLQGCSTAEGVWVDDHGGYRDLLVAVDASVKIEDCEDFFTKMEELTTRFSRDVWRATEKRLHVASVDIIVDDVIAAKCDVMTVGTRQKWTNADIRLADGGVNILEETEHVLWRDVINVRQPMGCSKRGDVIRMDSSILSLFDDVTNSDLKTTNGTKQNNVMMERKRQLKEEMGEALVSSWARYRWGVFEEFPVATTNLLDTPQQISKENLQENEEKRCSYNATGECKTPTVPTEQLTQTDLNVSQSTVSRQELICGKGVLDVVDSHPDLRKTSTLKKIFEFPASLTTVTPRGDIPSDSVSSVQKFQVFPKSFNIQNNTETENFGALYPEQGEVEDSSLLGDRKIQKRDVLDDEYPSKMTVQESNDLTGPPTTDFIGALPPVPPNETLSQPDDGNKLLLKSSLQSNQMNSTQTVPSHLTNQTIKTSSFTSWASLIDQAFILTSPFSTSLTSDHSVTRVTSNDSNHQEASLDNGDPSMDISGLRPPTIRFMSSPRKALVIALDLSSPSVTQASVEWMRGGLLRWLFGVGDEVWVGILASYSNTSFPLSLGPLGPGPSTARQLKEHMALLPYQHEVDDDVYGGLYCVSCAVNEAEKMLKDSGIPIESSTLLLALCEPRLTNAQIRVATESPISIHTLALCPNAPLTVERLASNQGSWSLSQSSMESGFAAEVQIGQLITQITENTLLWPEDKRLHTVHEENKMLREDDVERVGAYRRVRGTITLDRGSSSKLIILSSSSPAKVVELWAGDKRIEMIRDTTRRYWVRVHGQNQKLTYVMKYLSTSLELPLMIAVGIYESREETGLKIKVRTNTRHFRPMSSSTPFLKVWAEVTKDGQVIRDADVTLSVTYLSVGAPSTYSLMLLDDGSTEPDMAAGDSIYSRYLTWTPGSGRYILTATASSTSNTVSEHMTEKGMTSSRTGHFTIVSSSISLIVEMVPLGDIFPPSRITDLEVSFLGKSLVNISWSAPGGDLDQGSAWRYELKMYTEKDALSESNFDSIGIDVYCIQGEERAPLPAPALFRTPQFCLTSIPFSNMKWYFAIRAIDGANNTGRISNIVSAYVFEPTQFSFSEENGFQDDVQKVMMSTVIPDITSTITEDDYDSWRVYGAALVGAVSFVMLSIVLFACFICCRKARLRALKDPERPIYKIYVNNAYIQEEDGEIKVVSKEKSLTEKNSTQQWINSLDKYSAVDPPLPREENVDASVDPNESSSNSPSKFSKPIRFGVLTNGSIMRELPASSSSSSSSKPSEEATPDDFKYKDLSETISNSTTDGATASTSSAGTEISTAEPVQTVKEPPPVPAKGPRVLSYGYDPSYQPLGIPTLPGPTVIPIHYPKQQEDYHSDDEGGFRPRMVQSPGPKKHLGTQFSSFRYFPPPPDVVTVQQSPIEYAPMIHPLSKGIPSALSHGTVRSVKKRRHISFV